MSRSDWHTQSLDLSWREFFRDPSKWSDTRSSSKRRRSGPMQPPDFKHKTTNVPLWMDNRANPSWVHHELQRHGFVVVEHCDENIGTPDSLLPSLWACSRNKDLFRGIKIHSEIHKRGLPEKDYSDALVTMYAKCGELQRAQALLDKYSSNTAIPWTALIGRYAQQRQGEKALGCYEQMRRKGVLPDAVTYASTLKACGVAGLFDEGKKIHDEILRQGLLEHDVVLGNAIVDMYAKCGALSQAQSILENLPSRNVVSWNALIAGYAENGQGQQALECLEKLRHDGIRPDRVTYGCIFKACAVNMAIDKAKKMHDEILKCMEHMQHEGVVPNAPTYACILKACATIKALNKGKKIHDEILRQGLLKDNIVLGGALVDMYAKCGELQQAQQVLEKLPSRNVVLWNALIAGYAESGQGKQALECLEKMQHEGICPDAVTYICVLKACAVTRALDKGKQIHDEISRQGLLEQNVALGGALVDMYSRCGTLCQALSVLEKLPSRDVVSWSALISGYVENGQGQQALECLEKMQHEGVRPDAVAYVCILKACGLIRAIDKGKQIHEEIKREGWLEHHRVLGGALVDMYAMCAALQEARSVLRELPCRDAASWNALIAGYVREGDIEQAFKCLDEMQHEGVHPDAVAYVSILKACGLIRAIDKGKQIHEEIKRQGWLEHHIVLGGALVDMYAQCAALPEARSVLERLPHRDVASWNALISGYVREGEAEQAFKCLDEMQHEDIFPDMVTFVCLLNLCSHLGMLEKGQELFDCMNTKYGLKRDVECFTCMVDLLGRAGHLVKAAELIQHMPVSANCDIWHCLLGACRKWVNVEVGAWAFEQALSLDKCDGAAYVLMVNIYALAGMPEKAREIEAMRISNKAWKQPGCSLWTDSKNTVHKFYVNKFQHFQAKEIKLKLEDIVYRMSQEGYYPDLDCASQDLLDTEKAQLLCVHSEKLALVCALINTPPSEEIVIRKNMRMCDDCHAATALISKIEKRKIIMMDANRNHHFENGMCSCKGYL